MQQMETQGPGTAVWVVCALLALFYIATMWTVYEKAGKPGWAAIIPIYNTIVLLQIGGKPWWWILLLLIPLVNIVFAIMMHIGVARAFGKGVGFGWGLALLGIIFFPILAWGDAQYQGPPPA